jgi:hypothetical protein
VEKDLLVSEMMTPACPSMGDLPANAPLSLVAESVTIHSSMLLSTPQYQLLPFSKENAETWTEEQRSLADTGCKKDYFFQKNPKNIVMVFQNILSSFLRKNCKKIKHTL